SGLLLGGDHHHHLPAFQARPGLDHDVLAQVGLDPGGHLPAQFLVAHLAATEADVDLDLVAILQEAAHLAQLDLVIALVGDRAELHFLDLDLLGLLLGQVGLLLGFELELAEVHDPAHRRIGVGLDLHEVQALFTGHAKRVIALHHAHHLAVAANHAYFRHADVLVATVLLIGIDWRLSSYYGCRRAQAPGWDCVCNSSANSSIVIDLRSSPERVRTATACCSFSRSPTTSRNGTRCRVCSRIL